MAEKCTSEVPSVAIVMVPLPAQGHLNQFLHLSRLISSLYNIPVHYIGSTVHIQQAKLRDVHGCNSDMMMTNLIHFHEFPTPFEAPPPNPSAHKFPNHLMPSFFATSHLREPVCSLVSQLLFSYKKVIVIYDYVMSWVVQDLPALPNTECYCFVVVSAAHKYSFSWKAKGELIDHPGTELYDDIPSTEDCHSAEFLEYLKIQRPFKGISCGELYNSSRAIEGLYLDLIAKENNGLKQWAIGPVNIPLVLTDEKQLDKHHTSLDWLDKQEPNSVILVSFGTTTSLSNEEIEELALGLEKSQQKFIWVLRDADKGDVFAAGEVRRIQLPQGYEERITKAGRGIILRDWAPQLEILAHSSTGGFMSHCGWNSCLESISMGVPIVAWPMHSDQSTNSQLVTKFLKIGLMVSTQRSRQHHELQVTSGMIENSVKTLMASHEGDKMRKRAADLSNAVKLSAKDGGISRTELDSFISHITR